MGVKLEWILGAWLCGMLIPTAGAEEAERPNAELLEFLGSWDVDDEAWGEFIDMASESVTAETQPAVTEDADGET